MPATGQVIGTAVAFVRLGMKFLAPGIALPLRLGTAVLITALLTITPGAVGWTLLVVTAPLLATQTVLLRPRLDRRAQQIITGHPPPPPDST